MTQPHVLVVDDDQLIRAMVRDALNDVPCELRESASRGGASAS
jgi:CheY-like chemotaxis protein